ncbi:MAG: 4Fe-4S binding protein [Mogibacterium sp.]|nr:4Fe-4S binding protein [Mogibacterium sp.]
MEDKDYLKLIVEELHTSVMATVDENGYPVTAAIDIMDYDDESLYFLTARGKSLYTRLKNNGHLAITLMKGTDTMHTLAVSVKGCAEEIGPDRLPELFEKNPYMYEIYRNEESRRALTVFRIYEGTGEWFSMDGGNIEHASFRIGDAAPEEEGYFITDACTGCESCLAVCPRGVISLETGSAVIDQAHCIRCGNCREACPAGAVIPR